MACANLWSRSTNEATTAEEDKWIRWSMCLTASLSSRPSLSRSRMFWSDPGRLSDGIEEEDISPIKLRISSEFL